MTVVTTGEDAAAATSAPPAAEGETLAKRDYWLIPLVAILTVILMFVVAEAVTRSVWNAHEENSCVVVGDPIDGYRIKPNCTSRTKSAEGPWATYRFNECGYRSNTSCGPVPPGTLRIAILGASVSQGLNVPYDDTYFARSAADLSRLCGRPVDVQNMGKPKSSPIYAYRRVDDALALKPDVILFLLAPFDLEQQINPRELAERDNPARPIAANAVHEPLGIMRRLQLMITESRTVLVAEHFLLQNRDTFLRLYLNYGDKADYLREPLTDAWQKRFADMDLIIGGMAAKIRAAGVQFVVIPVPARAEAALLSAPHRPAGIDPAAFGRRLEAIATAHGADYVDLMQPFSRIANSQDLFLVVDGHVAAGGQRVIAQSLTEKLARDGGRGFSGCGSRKSTGSD